MATGSRDSSRTSDQYEGRRIMLLLREQISDRLYGRYQMVAAKTLFHIHQDLACHSWN